MVGMEGRGGREERKKQKGSQIGKSDTNRGGALSDAGGPSASASTGLWRDQGEFSGDRLLIRFYLIVFIAVR